jgi:hypothetical protein
VEGIKALKGAVDVFRTMSTLTKTHSKSQTDYEYDA